jgi:hypothetical protein
MIARIDGVPGARSNPYLGIEDFHAEERGATQRKAIINRFGSLDFLSPVFSG